MKEFTLTEERMEAAKSMLLREDERYFGVVSEFTIVTDTWYGASEILEVLTHQGVDILIFETSIDYEKGGVRVSFALYDGTDIEWVRRNVIDEIRRRDEIREIHERSRPQVGPVVVAIPKVSERKEPK